ncbi:MAG TPA: TauD/TfdA family dioxygenase [Acidimicrobiia bacterium]|nr:TauD/TfdA family dioxygenase [Acidimicrobiia bacterium]
MVDGLDAAIAFYRDTFGFEALLCPEPIDALAPGAWPAVAGGRHRVLCRCLSGSPSGMLVHMGTGIAAIEITPLTPEIGAEVRGVDLASDLSAETISAIRTAWLDHLVLFFPEQRLTPDTQVVFARRFGDITEGHPVEPSLPGHPNVLPIDSVKDRVDFWHTDVTFMSKPPTGSLLYAVQLPAVGGDTLWISTRAAYAALAEPLRQMCDGLTAIHYDPHYAQVIADGGGKDWEGHHVERLRPVEHPVVRVHPETGRCNLFVNPQFTVALKGFDGPQGNGLLRVLYDHMVQPRFTVRYRWHPHTLAFWDNRATMHYGVYDYEGSRRVMHRVTLEGDRPYGPESAAADGRDAAPRHPAGETNEC